jgi:hypothetical protein
MPSCLRGKKQLNCYIKGGKGKRGEKKENLVGCVLLSLVRRSPGFYLTHFIWKNFDRTKPYKIKGGKI